MTNLETYLLAALREHLHLPEKYTDEIIRLNLLYLFTHDDVAALNWIEFIEKKFGIDIPDMDAGYSFLSGIENMAAIIQKYSPDQGYLILTGPVQ